MSKKINRLTEAQKARIPEWVDKWIKIGLQAGETDWDTFNRYIRVCYEKAGLPFPNNIVRVSSPIVGAFAASIANKILSERGGRDVGGSTGVRGAVADAVRDAVDDVVAGAVGGAVVVADAVDDAVAGAVGGAVASAVVVADAVGDAVRGAVVVADAVGDAVRDAVGDAVRDAVRDAVAGAVVVADAVDDAVRDAVGDAVRDAVADAVAGAVVVADAVDDAVRGAVAGAVADAVAGARLDWHYWLGGQFWVGGWWGSPSYVSFFTDVCGLELDQDVRERAGAYRKICESANYIWCNSHFVMVCARPTRISRNAKGFLHNTRQKAIEYPDGWGLYYLNGVRFPEDLFKKVTSGAMSFADILAIKDTDQRTQAMRFGDVREFIKHANGEKLDEFDKMRLDGTKIGYQLYKFPTGKIFTKDAYFMIYDDIVPGSDKWYMSGVPEMKTVPDAMGWKFSIGADAWKALVPGLDMN